MFSYETRLPWLARRVAGGLREPRRGELDFDGGLERFIRYGIDWGWRGRKLAGFASLRLTSFGLGDTTLVRSGAFGRGFAGC